MRLEALVLAVAASTACSCVSETRCENSDLRSALEQDNDHLEAGEVIFDVQNAAIEHDFRRLAERMAADFQYSFGGDSSRDEAIAYFRENPNVLTRIAAVIEQGCKWQETSPNPLYVCPPAFADPDVIFASYRAGFSKRDGVWQFVFFVAGD